ncbi:hypothetical protein JCM10449v2_008119 [Rhodotorula kratochvilovae]
MSIPHLPDELLVLILRHAAGHAEVGALRWAERQDTLLACCLASKRLLAIARPLLWEAVRVNTVDIPSAFVEEAGSGLGRFVQALCVRLPHESHPDFAAASQAEVLLNLLACFPHLVELRLHEGSDGQQLRLGSLAIHTSHLQRLSLVGCHLTRPFPSVFARSSGSAHPPFIFPALKELSLAYCQTDASGIDYISEFFTAAVLPSLRTLCYSTGLGGPDDEDYPTVDKALLAQLEVLEIEGPSPNPLPEAFYASAAPILHSLDGVPETLEPRMRHVALPWQPWQPDHGPGAAAGVPAGPDELSKVAVLVLTGALASLWLPETLSPERDLEESLARGRDAVLAACAEKKVHVGWTAVNPLGYGIEDEFVLPEFWEYARGLKRPAAEGH